MGDLKSSDIKKTKYIAYKNVWPTCDKKKMGLTKRNVPPPQFQMIAD